MIVIDTTTLIDIERGRPGVAAALGQFHDEDIFAMSALTLREMHVGVGYAREKLGVEAADKKRDNILKLSDDLDIIELTRDILMRAGKKEGELLAKGMRVDAEDIIIGICAEVMKASSLITRNPAHFTWCGVKVVSYSI